MGSKVPSSRASGTKRHKRRSSKRPIGKPASPSWTEEVTSSFDRRRFEALAELASRGEYISAEELATALEANPGTALPDALRDYLCRFLRGKVKRTRGRKKKHLVVATFELVAVNKYYEILAEIQRESNPRGRAAIGKDRLPPHEEAAKRLQKMFPGRFGSMTLKSILNLVSSYK